MCPVNRAVWVCLGKREKIIQELESILVSQRFYIKVSSASDAEVFASVN